MTTKTLVAAKIAAAAALAVTLSACDSINIKLPSDGVTVDVSQQQGSAEERVPYPDGSPTSPVGTGSPGKTAPGTDSPGKGSPDKSTEPTKDQPQEGGHKGDKPADDKLNVISVGDGPSYFYDPASGSDCIIKSTSVYCYTGSINQFGKKLDGTKICHPAEEEETVHDAILADGKFWFGCSHEPVWTLYMDGTETNADFLVDWIHADKTGQHQPGLEKSDVSPPVLLPNTKLVSGKHTCISSATDLKCEDTTTGASFTMTDDELTVTKESKTYPRPLGIL